MDAPLKELNNLELHDQGIKELFFDFPSGKIIIVFSIYNDEKSNYDYIETIFSNVENVNISEMNLEKLWEIQIFSHDVFEIADRSGIKFILLTGFGKRDFEFSFSFSKYEMRGVKR